MSSAEHAVVIAGGGPVGMMLAAELALAEVDVAVLERRPDHELVGSRAGGFHARTIELLDQRGVAERFLSQGRTVQAAMFGTTQLDMSDFPTRHPYTLGIWQNQIERIMSGWITELPVRILYGREAIGVAQDESGVDVRLAGGDVLRCRYLVGCDGGRSLVRREAGIEFPGWEATNSKLIAEVELTEEPPRGIRHDAIGVHGLHRMEDGRTVRCVVTEQRLEPEPDPGLDELRQALRAVYGTDFGAHSPTWISRFTDATRQAASYRAGRVLLAGDAAHIHSPAGGQGLSLGLQDAANLGWKLAQVVSGTSGAELLDSYHAERHPATARALRHTMAQSVLQRGDPRIRALAEVVSELAVMEEPRRLLAGIVSGLDIHYDLGEGHPLLGRRMPDLDLERIDGRRARVFELLHAARPVLLNLGAPGRFEGQPLPARVQAVEASYSGEWELPVIGPVLAPSAVLIRPDGYVAWVCAGAGDGGLAEALAVWFGAPSLPRIDPAQAQGAGLRRRAQAQAQGSHQDSDSGLRPPDAMPGPPHPARSAHRRRPPPAGAPARPARRRGPTR
ncbi:MAG TPA: FAD-dependent monooxygenase [Solirubrobacteraceae bacterium]|nr:FAD-dependent monooxygenase [Solirubrobacteraceae bacterium]